MYHRLLKGIKIKNTRRQKIRSDPLLIAKLFAPWGKWSWYIAFYDSNIWKCFWYIPQEGLKLCYFDIKELEEIEWPYWMRIEKDIFYKPIRFSKLIKQDVQ